MIFKKMEHSVFTYKEKMMGGPNHKVQIKPPQDLCVFSKLASHWGPIPALRALYPKDKAHSCLAN